MPFPLRIAARRRLRARNRFGCTFERVFRPLGQAYQGETRGAYPTGRISALFPRSPDSERMKDEG